MTTGRVRDFDLHPDEDALRAFTSGPDGVLRLSGDAYVSAALEQLPRTQRDGRETLRNHDGRRRPCSRSRPTKGIAPLGA